MRKVMKMYISSDIKYIGVNDHEIDLFCLNSVTNIKDNLDSGVNEESTEATEDSTEASEVTEEKVKIGGVVVCLSWGASFPVGML